MNKKSVYDYFIGLLALMLSLIIVIDIFVSIPKEVRLSFYYIENIIRLIFIGDYIGRLVLSKNKKEFFKENIIDYLYRFIKYTLVVVLTYLIVQKIVILISINGILGLLIKGVVSLILSILIMTIVFIKTNEIKHVKKIFKDIKS